MSDERIDEDLLQSDADRFLGLYGVAAAQAVSHLWKTGRACAWQGRFTCRPVDSGRWQAWRDWLGERVGHEITLAYAVESRFLPIGRLEIGPAHVSRIDPETWFGPAADLLEGREVVIVAVDLGGRTA